MEITYFLLVINLSFWGFKSGAVNVWVAIGRMRRQVRSDFVDIDSAPDIQNVTPLDVILVNAALESLSFSFLLYM